MDTPCQWEIIRKNFKSEFKTEAIKGEMIHRAALVPEAPVLVGDSPLDTDVFASSIFPLLLSTVIDHDRGRIGLAPSLSLGPLSAFVPPV